MGAVPSLIVPVAIIAWLAAVNVAAFVVAVADKRRARRGARRIPEKVLLGFALLGGWLGELLAFLAVRHKTRKASFLALFFPCVLVNLVVLTWIFFGLPPRR